MPITRAGPSDARRIQQLIARSRYAYTNFGAEDLSTLLADGVIVMATENDHPNAYLCLKRDGVSRTQPPTMAAAFDDASLDAQEMVRREYLRGVAIERDYSPTIQLAELLDAAIAEIERESTDPLELICYSNDKWLIRALISAGFEIQERIEFFRLNRLKPFARGQRVEAEIESPPLQMRALQSNELKDLVALDAVAFNSFWHLKEPQMLEMLFRARVRVAEKDGEIVGYSALILSGEEASAQDKPADDIGADMVDGRMDKPQSYIEAQLARLAIHPRYHGRGFGRMLLAEVLDYANEQRVNSISLNTQTSNNQSRRLYKSFGFQTTGQILPVLRKRVCIQAKNRPNCPHP